MIKTTKEEFIVSAAEYLDRCIQEEERVRIVCEDGRCVLVDGETWMAVVEALGQVMGVPKSDALMSVDDRNPKPTL